MKAHLFLTKYIRLLCLFFGMVVLVAPFSATITAQDDAPASGIDLVILIDNAYENNPPTNIQEDTANMYVAARSVVGYLRDRIVLQNSGEVHTASVIRFNGEIADPLLEQTEVTEVTDQELLQEVTDTTPSSVCLSLEDNVDDDEDCYTSFETGFSEGRRQLESLESLEIPGQRRTIFILLTNSLVGHKPPFGPADITADINAIGTAVGDAELYVYGFTTVFQGTNASWDDNDDSLLWTNITEEENITRLEPSSELTSTLLAKLRGFLEELGKPVDTSVIDVLPYQASLSLFYFKTNTSDRITFTYEGDVVDTTALNIDESASGDYLQVFTFRNPLPGEWRVTGSNIAPGSLELVNTPATFENFMRIDDTPSEEALTNQEVELVWRAVGHDGIIINYGLDAYKPVISAQVGADYTVNLTQVDSSGAYFGEFYSLVADTYPVTTTAQLGGASYNSTSSYDIEIKAIELVIEPDTATQFNDWGFTAHFSEKGSAPEITTPFATPVTLSANMTYNGGNYPLNEPVFNANGNIYTFAPIEIPFNNSFDLTVTASATDFNRQPVLLNTQNEDGKQTITVTADNARREFSDATPRMLDTTKIIYEPANIDADEFQTTYNPSLVAIITEDIEGGSSWRLPLTTIVGTGADSYYEAEFYATSAVTHTLQIVGTTNYQGNNNLITFVDVTAEESLNPRPVTVEMKSLTTSDQFRPYTFEFHVLDNGNPLTTAFTSGIIITPALTVAGDPTTITPVAVGIDRYTADYTFVRSGDYPITANFQVTQNPNVVGGEPRSIPLAVTGNPQITVTKTPTLLAVQAGNETRDSSPILTPLTFSLQLTEITAATIATGTAYAYDETITANLILSAPNQADWVIQMPYNAETNRYEASFTPAFAANYTFTAQVTRTGSGSTPIISTADVGSASVEIRPLTVDIIPLTETSFRQNDSVPLTFTLLDNEQRYTQPLSPAPSIAYQVLNSAGEPIRNGSLDHDETNNNYTITLEPLGDLGSYTVTLEAIATDSLNRPFRLAISDNVANLSFQVAETQNLIVVPLIEAEQASTSPLPFTSRNPIIVRVQLDSVSATTANLSPRLNPETISIFNSAPDTWYDITVRRASETEVVPADSYQVSYQSIENGILTYQVSGLPDAPDYIVEVKFKDELEEPIRPYRILPENRVRSLPVSYVTNPIQTGAYIGMGVLGFLLVSGVLLTRRSANRRFPPLGYLYLTDDANRTFWVYDLGKNVATNNKIIDGAQGWERARINSIEVISDRKLKHGNPKEQIKVKLTINKTPDQAAFTLMLDNPPVPIGDQRFKLGRSAEKKPLYTADDELKEIKKIRGTNE